MNIPLVPGYGGGKTGGSTYDVYAEIAASSGQTVLSKADWIETRAKAFYIPDGGEEWSAPFDYSKGMATYYGGSLWLAQAASLGVVPGTSPAIWGKVLDGIDQAIYDDLLAQAQDAATAAQAARVVAEDAAARVDLGALDAAVAQTGADVVEITALKDSVEDIEAAVLVTAASKGAWRDVTIAAAIADGVAALVVGDQFTAAGDDVDYIGYYKIDAGPVATEIGRFLSVASVSDLTERAKTVPRRLVSTTGGPAAFTTTDATADDWEPDAIYTVVFPDDPGDGATITVAGRSATPLLRRNGTPVAEGDLVQNLTTLWQYDAVAGGLRMLSTPHRLDGYTSLMMRTFSVRLQNQGGVADDDGFVQEYTADHPHPFQTINDDYARFVWRCPAPNRFDPTLTLTSADGTVRTARQIRARAGGRLQEGDLLAGALYDLEFNPINLSFEMIGAFTERVRKDVARLFDEKRDGGDFDPIATLSQPGFMSPTQVASLKFVAAQLEGLNLPPTDITASNIKFSALHSSGDAVAEFFVTDATVGDAWSWGFSPAGGADNASFTLEEGIVGGRVALLLAADPVAGSDYEVSIRVLDSAGNFFDKAFTISAIAARGGGLDAITEKWLAKIDIAPTVDQVAAMDRWVTNAVAPISAKIVHHWYDRWPAGQSGLVNIVGGRYNLRAVGDVSFTPGFGWKSGGTTGGLDSGWVPAEDPGGFLMRNSAFWGHVTEDVSGYAYAMGCSNPRPWAGATNRFMAILPRRPNNTVLAGCGHISTGLIGYGGTIANTDARGLYLVNREGFSGPSVAYKSRPDLGEVIFTELGLSNFATTSPPMSSFQFCRAGDGEITDPHAMNAGMILRDTLTPTEIAAIALEFPLLEVAFTQASGALTLEDTYDSATSYAATSEVINPTSSQPDIIIRGRPGRVIGDNGGAYWHPGIKLKGAAGKRPQIIMRNREVGYPRAYADVSAVAIPETWEPAGWFSADDGATWQKMSTASYEYADPVHDKTTVFQHGAAFTGDVIFRSFPGFSAARWQEWLTVQASNPLIQATAQSLTPGAVNHEKFTIATTTAFTDTIGRSVAAWPVHMFTLKDAGLSNPDASPKRQVVITNGTHPGESAHSWNLLGFLEWALSDDEKAVEYRSRFETTVIPYMHPHALAAGYERVEPLNLEAGSTTKFRDGNRGWQDGDLTDTAGKVKPKLMAHVATLGTGGRISIGMDFHELSNRSASYFWNSELYPQDLSDTFETLWSDELDAIGSPLVVTPIKRNNAYLNSPATAERALFIDAMDATWALTPEQGPQRVETTDHLKGFGEGLGRALVRMYQAGILPDRTST